MTLKYYYDALSQPSRAVYLFLKVNNIPFEKHPVQLMEGQHRKKEFRKLNPLALVPVIDDDGFILRESVGILRYLVREKNVADHWYPKESRSQAKVDEFIEWQHIGLRVPLGMYFRVLKLEPMLSGKPPLESDIKRFTEITVRSCDLLENIWLRNEQKFIFGDHLTIADLLAVMELEQPRMAGYDPRNGRPKIKAFMDNVRSATNPHYDEICTLINSFIDSKL